MYNQNKNKKGNFNGFDNFTHISYVCTYVYFIVYENSHGIKYF